MSRRSSGFALLAAVALFAPGDLVGQEAAEVLQGLRNGGGWVAVPIEGGVGSISTAALPSMGMTLTGCVNVWPGHSGSFEIRARDAISDSSLVMDLEPGEGVTFSHTFGLQAQVDFDFRWTEPRDTTLMLWVGLAIGKTPEEACAPVYGG